MGLFTRKKKVEVHNHYHTYSQTVCNPSCSALYIYSNPLSKTAIVATPTARLPACRNCSSSQRTQLAITQKGPNIGREYYVCIGCPAPKSQGRSWIVWADQITI